MSSSTTALSGSYNYLLVALSAVIAILAAYAALDEVLAESKSDEHLRQIPVAVLTTSTAEDDIARLQQSRQLLHQ